MSPRVSAHNVLKVPSIRSPQATDHRRVISMHILHVHIVPSLADGMGGAQGLRHRILRHGACKYVSSLREIQVTFKQS